MDKKEFLISYKHPRKRKLLYITVIARTLRDAFIKAPSETSTGYLFYGIH